MRATGGQTRARGFAGFFGKCGPAVLLPVQLEAVSSSPQRDIDSKEDVCRGVFTGLLYSALFALLNANRYERTCLMTDSSS